MIDEEQVVANTDIKDSLCFFSRIMPSDFQVLRALGQGSFGKVYLVQKGFNKHNGKLFAMKVLKKASLKLRDRIRTKIERDILAAVRHPFIVRLEYAFQTEGKLYLVMEYINGGDLFSRLSREVTLCETDVRFYLAELILALTHLHQLGIIYRDLKPENILLDSEGHIKLTDFGLSKMAVNKESGGRAFSFCGTIEYMAPEVITRRGHDSAADWWSLGVLMFEMLCGILPFQSDSRRGTMNQILRAKLHMPQFLSLEAQSLLRGLFKRNPANRLGHGIDALDQFQQHEFFCSICWTRLLNRSLAAPHQPLHSKDPIVLPTFDSINGESPLKDSPSILMSNSLVDHFSGFTYPALNSKAHGYEDETSYSQDTSDEERGMKLYDSPFAFQSQLACQSQSENVKWSEPTWITPSAFSNTSELSAKFEVPFCDSPQGSWADRHIEKSSRNFLEDYDLLGVISQSPSTVFHNCNQKETSERRVVKIISKRCYDPSEEIAILQRFRHLDNVITLYEIYDTETHTYMIMEHLNGSSLLSRVSQQQCLSECEAAAITNTLVKTLYHIHRNNVVHVDLKPSNLTFADLNDTPQSLRICSFRTAMHLETGYSQRLNRSVNVEDVVSENLRCSNCTPADDMWSLGRLLEFMLLGSGPYSPKQQSSMDDGYTKDDLRLLDPKWSQISEKAKDIIRLLLNQDPRKRPTTSEVLSHPWIRNCYQMESGVSRCYKEAFNNVAPNQSKSPTLQPVTSSKLAARRHQSRMQANASVHSTIPKPPALSVEGPSGRTCISSLTLLRVGSQIPPVSSDNDLLNRNESTKPTPGSLFVSSATFELTNPDFRSPFCSYARNVGFKSSRVVA